MTVRLYDYWRSSASYRVRIALNLKGIAYTRHDISLIAGDQRTPEHLARNPQGLVPALEIDGHMLTQSLAIIDYLDTRFPAPPLYPADPAARTRIQAMALAIVADIHPLNNLRVLNYLKDDLGIDQQARDEWYRRWIIAGFTALEAMAGDSRFLGGDTPGAADICLVAQMYNARRFNTPLAAFPKLVAIDAACTVLPAFAEADPACFAPS